LLYAPLANSWCKIYPGCLNLSETRNINPRSDSNQVQSLSTREISSSNTVRGSYNPPEQSSFLPKPSLKSAFYSSVLQMVGTARQQEFSSSNSRGGYERLGTEEIRSEEDHEDRRAIKNWNPTSAVASLGLAMKDLANDPFGSNNSSSVGTIPLASPGASNKIYSV
jgi:hypothetical protein